jgi:hypothetical protein
VQKLYLLLKTLERAFDEPELSAADRAAVEVKILKFKKGGALESHFETETSQKLCPWKVQQEEAFTPIRRATCVVEHPTCR